VYGVVQLCPNQFYLVFELPRIVLVHPQSYILVPPKGKRCKDIGLCWILIFNVMELLLSVTALHMEQVEA
jgi:hypothetical protein